MPELPDAPENSSPPVHSPPVRPPLGRRLLASALRISAALAVFYVLSALALACGYGRLVYRPGKNIPVTPGDLGTPYSDIWLETGDGCLINAWLVPSHPWAASGLTLLLLHGGAGNLHSAVLPRSLFFRTLGFDVFAIDYHGFGKSGGAPSEAAVYLDAEAAWRHLTETLGVPPRSIVILGQDLGGGAASWLAERHPEAGGLILESTFTSLPDLFGDLLPFYPARLLIGDQFNTLARLPNIRAPLLVMHARGGRPISFAHGERLFAAYAGEKSFLILEDVLPGGRQLAGPGYVDALRKFMKSLPAWNGGTAREFNLFPPGMRLFKAEERP